jgi:hypothetical protein
MKIKMVYHLETQGKEFMMFRERVNYYTLLEKGLII